MPTPSPFPRSVPYNGLPLLPPAQEVESKRVLKLTIRARAALSDLKGAGRLIPNQAMLVRAILLQEAKSSSEVENIVTTNDDLYQALSRDQMNANAHTKEVLRYGDAVWAGHQWLASGRLLTPNLFCEIASLVNDARTDVRTLPGTRIANPLTGEVVYSPPEGEDAIRRFLHNLCQFLYAEDDVDPLVKLAIAHYQFEAIHPFHDGNGRTGRILNILYLVERGLLDLPILYLSRFIIANKGVYYQGLREVTESGSWDDWIAYVLEGIASTADETRRRIEAIHAAMIEAARTVRELAPNIYSRELVEIVFSQPYTRIASLESIAKRQTASQYLRRLEELGLLRSVKVWRETLYLNPRLMELLTE